MDIPRSGEPPVPSAGRAGRPRPAHFTFSRRRLIFIFSFASHPHSDRHAAEGRARRISGRTGPDPPYLFHFRVDSRRFASIRVDSRPFAVRDSSHSKSLLPFCVLCALFRLNWRGAANQTGPDPPYPSSAGQCDRIKSGSTSLHPPLEYANHSHEHRS